MNETEQIVTALAKENAELRRELEEEKRHAELFWRCLRREIGFEDRNNSVIQKER